MAPLSRFTGGPHQRSYAQLQEFDGTPTGLSCLECPMHGVMTWDGLLAKPASRRRCWRSGSTTFMLAVVVAVVVCLIATVMTAPASQARDVIGDDERDVFVGTGSLILPDGMARPGRESAADCPGCRWVATLMCDPVSPTACRGQARLCPNDHFWLRISLLRPGGSWQVLGSQCFSPGGPARRDDVESLLHQQIERAVPPLRPSHRPPAGILPHLPVIFDSGQTAAPETWTWSILGLPVSVTAQATWAWQFDAGGPVASVTRPGGLSVGDGVHHVYRDQGTRQVTVGATWSAAYSVGDLGPLTVSQPVNQVEQFSLQVGQARAMLSR